MIPYRIIISQNVQYSDNISDDLNVAKKVGGSQDSKTSKIEPRQNTAWLSRVFMMHTLPGAGVLIIHTSPPRVGSSKGPKPIEQQNI